MGGERSGLTTCVVPRHGLDAADSEIEVVLQHTVSSHQLKKMTQRLSLPGSADITMLFNEEPCDEITPC